MLASGGGIEPHRAFGPADFKSGTRLTNQLIFIPIQRLSIPRACDNCGPVRTCKEVTGKVQARKIIGAIILGGGFEAVTLTLEPTAESPRGIRAGPNSMRKEPELTSEAVIQKNSGAWTSNPRIISPHQSCRWKAQENAGAIRSCRVNQSVPFDGLSKPLRISVCR